MYRYVVKAWILLCILELLIRRRRFKTLHEMVRKQPVCLRNCEDRPSIEALCTAADYACVFYFRQVQCLQRSAATTILLRRYGWHAEMVIGAQLLPFKSHAWVEVGGAIVNDKPYVTEIYQAFERC